jgi:hypothetical protein
MLDRAYKLQMVSVYPGTGIQVVLITHSISQPINLFISSADQLYGPITVLRRDGRVVKNIPWSAFALSDVDWARVMDAKMILAVSLHLHTYHWHDDSHSFTRILTVFFITFQLMHTRVYIVHFQLSRTSKVHGKRNLRIHDSSSITTQLRMAWPS